MTTNLLLIRLTEEMFLPPLQLHERLLNHEAKLLNSTDAILPHGPVTVNVAQQRSNSITQHRSYNNNKPKHQGSHQGSNGQWNQTQQMNHYDNNKGQSPYLGRCQICGVQGHNPKRCTQLQNFQQQQQVNPFTPWNPRASESFHPLEPEGQLHCGQFTQ